VARSERQQHHDRKRRPDDPGRGDERQRNERPYRPKRDNRAFPTEHCVRDVTTVELPNRKQVERRGQHPEPRSEGHGMHVDRITIRGRPPVQPCNRLEQQRLAKFDEPGRVARQCGYSRKTHAYQKHRHCHHEPCDGPGNPDVEELAFAWNRLTDSDERAERARQRQRSRKEIG
jgi:hypothetical protein